jgi:hypothetical protein
MAVGTAGDVTCDGYADVVVGAEVYDQGQDGEGALFVWYGSHSGLGANGTPLNADWMAQSNQADARLGAAVGTAGDVNGDGCSDLIAGAYLYDHPQEDEGRVFVWHGSAVGLGDDGTSDNADWTAESDQAESEFGIAVGTAGDVDGNGYADVIVGAHRYSHGQDGEGRAYVYRGSATGLMHPWAWTALSDQADAAFGRSVGTAGDVNGDGYADVIVGAPFYDRCEENEGRAYVYLGGSAGLGGSPAWTAESNQARAAFGYSVGTAGDVNADGYADVIVGAYKHGNEHDEGGTFVYYGNGGQGLGLTPRQLRADNSGPIAHLGTSQGAAFRLALRARTPFGRGSMRLEWEVKPLGTALDGSGIQWTEWQDTGTGWVVFNELVSGLTTDQAYHWRVRLRYPPISTPFQQTSRWLTVPWNGWQEQDLRTPRTGGPGPGTGGLVYMPTILRTFE